MKQLSIFLSTISLFVMVSACFAEEYKSVGDKVRYAPIGEYTCADLQKVLTEELKAFETTPMGVVFSEPANGVKLYRVLYQTVIPEKNNRPTEASGLVAVPVLKSPGKAFPLVSWQHGTVYTKKEVPSFPENSMETRLVLAHLAGNGYVVIGADYIGMGLSAEPNSYMVEASSVQACADMLDAAKAVLADLNIPTGKLFLSGWSQGAYNTQVFRRHLEQRGIPIAAAATASTPSSPWMLFMRWFYKPTEFDAQWILGTVAQLFCSYEDYYGIEGLCAEAIRPEYVKTARQFYENRLGWSDVSGSWPQKTSEFMKPDFAATTSLEKNRFGKILLENQAYEWRSLTPARYYWGAADEAIAPYIATLPVKYQETIGGAEATAVFAGDKANHRGTFIFGIKDQKAWFDQFLE